MPGFDTLLNHVGTDPIPRMRRSAPASIATMSGPASRPAPSPGPHPHRPRVERLDHGNFVAEIAPDIGGSLASFYSGASASRPRIDWLRATSDSALRAGSPLGLASFPLVPWCNRIRDGRFEWDGHRVALPPNPDGTPHTIHGIGWRRPWRVVDRSVDHVDLAFDETGDGEWPFAFAATQRYALDDHGLTVRLVLRNTGTRAMPAGIGHHPYFAHRRDGDGTRVRASVQAMWRSDAELLPTTLSTACPEVAALREGMRLDRFELDNNFTALEGDARVAWPDGTALRLRAEAPLRHFVLYTPAQHDHFVMEAVSNCTDWLNLHGQFPHGDLGGARLAPGAELAATTRFEPMPAPSTDALDRSAATPGTAASE